MAPNSSDAHKHPSVVFNAPPGWPPAPIGWLPPPGWHPPDDWSPAPAGWDFYLELPFGGREWLPHVRSVAPRYADPGYDLPRANNTTNVASAFVSRSRMLPLLWGTPRRRFRTLALSAIVTLLFLSAFTSSGRYGNSTAVARQYCPPAVATEIAERLEIPESEVAGKPPTPGSQASYVPPRAQPRMVTQATIVTTSASDKSILAEGNYRAKNSTYWEFSCTIDISDKPTVTRVAISPAAAPATPAT